MGVGNENTHDGGGAGFRESHLCDKCAQEGDIVLCLDSSGNGNVTKIRPSAFHTRLKLTKGDINRDLCRDAYET